MYLKRLKELREDHDLIQKQVAIALKITRQHYGLYENGDRTLPIDKLFILSKFLTPYEF
ncbi:MAG: helix-turn-helix transcriptional regulator [Clostridia bacterium]|nr:helix-turn-helix transcriptional regulator [Clostridia bacterium]